MLCIENIRIKIRDSRTATSVMFVHEGRLWHQQYLWHPMRYSWKRTLHRMAVQVLESVHDRLL